MKAIMLGAPKPMTIPMIASQRCDLAPGFPVKNEKAANTSPKTAHNGRIVLISFDWIAPRVDSTLQYPATGTKRTERAITAKNVGFDIFIKALPFFKVEMLLFVSGFDSGRRLRDSLESRGGRSTALIDYCWRVTSYSNA